MYMGIETQDADFESGYGSTPTETPAAAKPDTPDPKPEPATAPEPVDPIKDLAARFEKFEAGHNKLAGHIGGLQRTQQEIQTALAAAQAATKTVADAPTQAQVKDAASSPSEWEKLKEGYPDWALATEKLLDSRMPPAFDAKAFEDKLMQEMQGKTEAMQEKIVNAALNAVFPGWAKEAKTDAFKAWLAAQPDDVKALSASDEIADAATLLKLYDASKTAKPAPSPTPTPKPEVSAREKRLAAAVNPRGTGGHASGSTDLDEFESGYNAG
jgi:hypothetical protein